jgi:hypothetical protein
MTPTLRAIQGDKTTRPEHVSARVKSLQAETRRLAREHVNALTDALQTVEQLAHEIATGGEAYAVGVRDLARRLAEDCATRAQTIQAIQGRTP